MVILVLLGALFVGFIVWKYWSLLIGAGYDPTPMHRVKKMLEIASIGEDDTVYDLGAGDGRIIVAASRHYRARAVGIEADPLRFVYTWVRLKLCDRGGRARVYFGDLFKCDLRSATVVTLFLYGPTNDRLRSKLMRELKPGSRVVSYVWRFKDWMFDKCMIDDEIYLYRIPARRPGDTD